MDRQRERDELIEKLYTERMLGWPHSEYDIDSYLHIAYDDFDVREELMLRFRCKDVVDFLLILLDKETIKTLLIEIIKIFYDRPMALLASSSKIIPKEIRKDACVIVSQLYRDNEMYNCAEVIDRVIEVEHRFTFNISTDGYWIYDPFHFEETRDGEREYLFNCLVCSRGSRWPYSMNVIENYIYLKYDDYDLNIEMMKKFGCQDVVDYLRSLLNEGQIRLLLKHHVQD